MAALDTGRPDPITAMLAYRAKHHCSSPASPTFSFSFSSRPASPTDSIHTINSTLSFFTSPNIPHISVSERGWSDSGSCSDFGGNDDAPASAEKQQKKDRDIIAAEAVPGKVKTYAVPMWGETLGVEIPSWMLDERGQLMYDVIRNIRVDNAPGTHDEDQPGSDEKQPKLESEPGRKPRRENCRYYLQFGRCKWGEGCRFYHDMERREKGMVECGRKGNGGAGDSGNGMGKGGGGWREVNKEGREREKKVKVKFVKKPCPEWNTEEGCPREWGCHFMHVFDYENGTRRG